jgi:hypothetical protein
MTTNSSRHCLPDVTELATELWAECESMEKNTIGKFMDLLCLRLQGFQIPGLVKVESIDNKILSLFNIGGCVSIMTLNEAF